MTNLESGTNCGVRSPSSSFRIDIRGSGHTVFDVHV